MADNGAILKAKAQELISKLAKNDVDANEVPESLRDYSIKISLVKGGGIQLYYSPKRKQFKLDPQNIFDPHVESVVQNELFKDTQTSNDQQSQEPSPLSVYVDGSYISGSVGYGAVAVRGNDILWKTSGLVPQERAGSSRQVAGELEAVLHALEWCDTESIAAVSIHYDYEGIEKWVTGEWKAKHVVSQSYREAVTKSQISISWVKVKAHSGNKWNDVADDLAKSGAKLYDGANTDGDLQHQFENLVSEMIAFLKSQGINSEKKPSQPKSYHHIQLKIWREEEDLGYVNAYGTTKKGVYALFHEVKSGLNDELSKAWLGRKSTTVESFSEIEHYYSALVVFRELRFDFRILAEAIAKKWNEKFNQAFNVQQNRYNFDALEDAIDHLRKTTKSEMRDSHA